MCAASTTPRETSVEAAAKSPRRRPVGRSWVPLVVGLALASQGCVYVTQKVREEKLTNLDQDGDGAPYDGPLGKEDCDDNNPKKSPLLEEIPYDGLDNDCGGDGDLVDIDGDGYPGILFADWKPENGVAWPDNVDQEALDCVDTLDPEADADRIAAGWEPAEIFPSPNNPNEIGYDGIDSDCAADNDFDGDEDGYLLDEVQADFESYVTLWGYEDRVASWFPSGAAAYGDCDDADPLAYPGNPDDALYDGRDANCDGVNDFDADGDGYMPPILPESVGGGETEGAFTTFVNKYGLQQLANDLPADITVGPTGEIVLTAFDDCLDVEDPLLTSGGSAVDPATVYPRERSPVLGGNGDTPYDGIDTDCNRDNDFDYDRDGFLVDEAELPNVEVAYTSYIAQWGYEDELAAWGAENDDVLLIEPRPDDCRDDDALTYPAALERLGDGVDQDCDGDSNASAFAFRGNVAEPELEFLDPSAPEVLRLNDLYAIVFTVDSWRQGTDPIEEEVGLIISFEVDEARSQAEPSAQPYRWKLPNPDLVLADPLDVAMVPDCTDEVTGAEQAYIGHSYQVATSNTSYVGWVELQASGPQVIAPARSISPADNDAVPIDIGITIDANCDPYVVSCSIAPTPLLHVTHGLQPLPNLASLQDDQFPGEVCYPRRLPLDDELSMTVCGGASCNDLELDINAGTGDPEIIPPITPVAQTWRSGNLHTSRDADDLITLLPDGGAFGVRLSGDLPLPIELLTKERVLSADAQLWNGDLYMAVVVDDPKNPIRLLHGDPDKPQVTNLTFVPPKGFEGVLPAEIGLHVDDDRIAVAVTALDPTPAYGERGDVLGWLFLGLPL